MEKLQVNTVDTIANTENNLDFDVKGYEFLVTNTTGDNVRITLGKTYDEANSVIVPTDCSRVVTVCKVHSLSQATDSVAVMPSATSTQGLEVQCILW